MEVNHFLFLSCSLEKELLVEWFFSYNTRRQCIVFLTSLVVLFKGNLLEWGQLFLGEILQWGGNFPGGNYPRGQLSAGNFSWRQLSSGEIVLGQSSRGQSSRVELSGGNYPRGQLSGGQSSRGQLSGGQFSSGAIVRTLNRRPNILGSILWILLNLIESL